MKHLIIPLAAAMLFLAAACSGGSPKETVDSTLPVTVPQTSIPDVSLLCDNGRALILGFVDIKNEMSADLFRGSYDDRLLDSLMPAGSTPSAINVFFVAGGHDLVLFDAGLGADKGGRLMEHLKQLNVAPDEVTAVCLTHLHGDHTGGLILDGQAAFPKATVYLSKEESDAATGNGLWMQVTELYKGRIKTFDDGEPLFNGLVVPELTPGHTPGHTSYLVADTCYVAGDLVHAQDLQLDHPQFCARYDANPKQATATRIRVLDRLRNSDLAFAGAHCHDHFIKIK